MSHTSSEPNLVCHQDQWPSIIFVLSSAYPHFSNHFLGKGCARTFDGASNIMIFFYSTSNIMIGSGKIDSRSRTEPTLFQKTRLSPIKSRMSDSGVRNRGFMRIEIAFCLDIVANFLWFWARLQHAKNKKWFMQVVCYSAGYCIFRLKWRMCFKFFDWFLMWFFLLCIMILCCNKCGWMPRH